MLLQTVDVFCECIQNEPNCIKYDEISFLFHPIPQNTDLLQASKRKPRGANCELSKLLPFLQTALFLTSEQRFKHTPYTTAKHRDTQGSGMKCGSQ